MAKYIYTHPTPTAFTLTRGKSYHLHQGHEYDLPSENAFVASLVEQGRLVEVKPEPIPEPVEAPKTSRKPNKD